MKTDRERLAELISAIIIKYISDENNECKSTHFAALLISKGVTIPVRCGECTGYYGGFCETWGEYGNSEDGFCNHGERKDK